jgi:hypothetical protein
LIKLTTNQDFNKDDVIFSITNADQFEIGIINNRHLFFNYTDFEAREDHTYSVEVTARKTGTGETTTKTITVTVTDLDDEAPTNIQINDAATDINGFVTLERFSGVETSAVVIRSILLCTVTVRVFTSVSKSFHQLFFQVALILTR